MDNMDVASIIAIAGGAAAIAQASKDTDEPVTTQATHKWRQRGLIPEERWSLLLKLCGERVSVADLHEINESARRARQH